jgi:hypothetical protein
MPQTVYIIEDTKNTGMPKKNAHASEGIAGLENLSVDHRGESKDLRH